MSQFGVSLPDNARVIIYDRNMFILQATAYYTKTLSNLASNIRLGCLSVPKTLVYYTTADFTMAVLTNIRLHYKRKCQL
jgi:hypothetical protein